MSKSLIIVLLVLSLSGSNVLAKSPPYPGKGLRGDNPLAQLCAIEKKLGWIDDPRARDLMRQGQRAFDEGNFSAAQLSCYRLLGRSKAAQREAYALIILCHIAQRNAHRARSWQKAFERRYPKAPECKALRLQVGRLDP